MENDDFHIPFLHSLIFIVSFTILSMIVAHNIIHGPEKQPTFTSEAIADQ